MRSLNPIITPQKSMQFAVCDIESMNWTKFIVLGHTNNGVDYHEFRSLKKYLAYLADKSYRGPTDIFAHFGGKFDFLFVLRETLRNAEYKILSVVPRGSSLLYVDIEIGKNRIVFRDSSALLPFALKSITENFGTQTQKGEWDHSKTRGYSKKLSSYLKADCHSLHQALTKFYAWPLIQKAGAATTMASQAMRVFRTYLKEPILGQSKFEADFCRKAYLGGRTEIFKPFCACGPLYEYDVNSLYPFVMANNKFPMGESEFVFDYQKGLLGIYGATVRCPSDMYIPVLGIIRDGKYIFPTGKFSGHWTSAEIEYAKSVGYQIEVTEGIVFKKAESIFHSFITDLYSIRQSAPKKSVSEVIAKLLMNSSYGRFGMNPEKENISFELKEGNIEYETIRVNKKNIQLYKEPVNLETFIHVGIAAFVTSYARIYMHNLYRQAGHHLFYTDTDSLFTSKPLRDDSALGGLKLEQVWDTAAFLLPKTYMAKSKAKVKRAMKGFQKSKIENFTMEDFQHGLEGDLRRFKIENEPKFATLKTALAQKKLVTMTKASTKQLKSVYNKRIVFREGSEILTRPISLEE